MHELLSKLTTWAPRTLLGLTVFAWSAFQAACHSVR